MYSRRMNELRRSLEEHDLDGAIITDDDNVYYLTGYYDYLHMEFGRPTILIVPRDGESLLITPSMEMDMAEAAARVDRIVAWNDGLGNEWREERPSPGWPGWGSNLTRCRPWYASTSARCSTSPVLATLRQSLPPCA
jgi:Xaa-Pro aminopeptidase